MTYRQTEGIDQGQFTCCCPVDRFKHFIGFVHAVWNCLEMSGIFKCQFRRLTNELIELIAVMFGRDQALLCGFSTVFLVICY
jgi:hypothetical protein